MTSDRGLNDLNDLTLFSESPSRSGIGGVLGNSPISFKSFSESAVPCTAQHRLYAPGDTCAARKLNKTAYLVEAEGNATTRKKRVLYFIARIHAGCPAEGMRL